VSVIVLQRIMSP